MRFDRIRLSNFKPYGDADLRLTDGVTVIHGLNGSGKSSLLEACFFALYGSKALEGTLDEVVTNGEEETAVELWFTHDGVSYHVERRLRLYDDRVDHQCTLEATDGSDVSRDGATAVRQFVTELLRMDAEAFVNCAYVRQGEVNKLINATPSQRQAMIDELLQLGTLEEYRDRAGDARLGVEDVHNARRAVLEDTEERIAELESKDLHDRLNALETRLSDVTEEIERYETQREQARTTRDEAADALAEHERKREELASVESDISEIETAIREAERKREEKRDAIADRRERIETLTDEIDERLERSGLDAGTAAAIERRRDELERRETKLNTELNETRVDAEGFRNQASNLAEKATTLAERADELEETATKLDERADELEAAAADAEREADEREASLTELREEADALRERFDGTDVERGEAAAERDRARERRGEVRERIAKLETELSGVRERIAEAEALLDAGNCPECGQPVADSPHADRLDDDRERASELEDELASVRDREATLDDRIETLSALVDAEERLAEIDTATELTAERVDDKRDAAATKREEAADKREEAGDRRDAAAAKREEAAELRDVAEPKREAATDAEERAAEIESALEGIATDHEHVDAVADRLDAIEEAESAIDQLRERRENLAAVNDERRERLTEKRERRDELREAVDDEAIETAKRRKEEAEEYLEKVEPKLDELEEQRSEIQTAIGGVTGEIDQLERLREDRDDLAATVEALEQLHEETADLESMYGQLRAELRQRNVTELERMLNETFELVYGNDAYSHIELDGEYELTVYQKDGEALAPEQLSGGERALFNLSLRCGIYRLLSEGIEGAAPTPPLILDEPTVFLDSGHVSRLVDLVEEMRGFGVRQILIVSHDDELVGAADELVTVEKDPRSNRSTVRREDVDGIDVASMADD